jgi:hypothetical protein
MCCDRDMVNPLGELGGKVEESFRKWNKRPWKLHLIKPTGKATVAIVRYGKFAVVGVNFEGKGPARENVFWNQEKLRDGPAIDRQMVSSAKKFLPLSESLRWKEVQVHV